jgi:hypothetical protein
MDNSKLDTPKSGNEINEYTRPTKTKSGYKKQRFKTTKKNERYEDNDGDNATYLNYNKMGIVNSQLKVNPRLRSIKREELKYNNAFQFNSSNELIQPLEECKHLFSDIGSTRLILITL